MAEGDGVVIGFEETTPWAASHSHHRNLVYNEACEVNKEWINREGGQIRYQHHVNLRSHRSRFRAEPPLLSSNSSSSRHHHQQRPKIVGFNRVLHGGGPGMQAFFINSCPRPSGGTGVFLPQRRDADDHESLNKKPACAPVLLPTRVVQALNLNVHALGLQIPKRQDVKYKGISGDSNSRKRRDSGNSESRWCVISQNKSFSPHIFLPKEWTY